MPTKRRRRVGSVRRVDLPPEAVTAWRTGDYWALWRALRLRVWQMPDWAADPPDGDNRPDLLRIAWPAPDVVALKTALVEIAGPPPRRWFYKSDP